MANTNPCLFIAWQDPDSRLIRVVARLHKRQEEGRTVYEFVYVNEARRAQAENGFRPFVSFPELEVAYRSETLFPFFTNRVIPRTRRDYPVYVSELGLSVEEATPEHILARSGGQRVTDHLEIFAPPSLNEETGLHEMFFLLRGIRYMTESTEQRIRELSPGERLYCMLDFQNPYNARAIALRTETSRHMLGYLPDYLVEDVNMLREQGDSTVLVERVNPPPAPREHRLLCRLQAHWPAEELPFSDERYQPVVTEPLEPAVSNTA